MCGLGLDLDFNKPNVKGLSGITGGKLYTYWLLDNIMEFIIYIINNFLGCKNDTAVLFKGKWSLSVRDFKSISRWKK